MRYGLLASVLLFLVGCAHNAHPAQTDVDRVWNTHETALRHAAKVWPAEKETLEAEVVFFEKTTGIGSYVLGYMGALPNRLDESLKQWREWYETHRKTLYVEPGTGLIRSR